MRLSDQDQLTALARFFDDVWKATPADTAGRGAERVRAAFGLWADAPSQATWEHFVEVLQEVVGEQDAAWMLADLEPYLGRSAPPDSGASAS